MESGAAADVGRLVVVVEENCFKGRVDPWRNFPLLQRSNACYEGGLLYSLLLSQMKG